MSGNTVIRHIALTILWLSSSSVVGAGWFMADVVNMLEKHDRTNKGDAMNRTRTRMVVACAVMLAGVTISQAATAMDQGDKPGDPYGIIRRPIPEKVVVLTFDDACLSHATVVGPLLKKQIIELTTRTLALLSLLQTGSVQYQDWRHSGSMYILATPEGANLPATSAVENFPLLVRMDKDFFDFKQAQAKEGSPLRRRGQSAGLSDRGVGHGEQDGEHLAARPAHQEQRTAGIEDVLWQDRCEERIQREGGVLWPVHSVARA